MDIDDAAASSAAARVAAELVEPIFLDEIGTLPKAVNSLVSESVRFLCSRAPSRVSGSAQLFEPPVLRWPVFYAGRWLRRRFLQG